jgi:hypothetical protein
MAFHQVLAEEETDQNEARRIARRLAPVSAAVEAVRAVEDALAPGSLSALLAERNKIHGDFACDAGTAQRLKTAMRDTVNWDALTDMQREALENIATKIGRILSGDPNHADHWSDIQGYARLIEQRL